MRSTFLRRNQKEKLNIESCEILRLFTLPQYDRIINYPSGMDYDTNDYFLFQQQMTLYQFVMTYNTYLKK